MYATTPCELTSTLLHVHVYILLICGIALTFRVCVHIYVHISHERPVDPEYIILRNTIVHSTMYLIFNI